MRKTGIACAIIGLVLAAGLFALQQTGWYADELLHRMSEPVEWIASGFWTSIGLLLLGLLLFGVSFRKPKPVTAASVESIDPAESWETDPAEGWETDPAERWETDPAEGWETEAAAQPVQGRVCEVCGTALSDTAAFCRVCGTPCGPAAAEALWHAPGAGQLRGTASPARETNWECPWCGRVWDDSASVCLQCGYQRFGDDRRL